MQKTLRVGSRPLAIVGGVLLPFIAVAGYEASVGDLGCAAKTLGWVLVGAAFFSTQLYFWSIRVDDEKITIHGWRGEKGRVYFSDVTRTHANVLFEPDFPLSIDIFCANPAAPAMVIKSKSLRKSDIAWLLSLPALKVAREKPPNQPPPLNAGSRSLSSDSPEAETPSSLGPRG